MDDSDHTDYVLIRWRQCEKMFLPKLGESLVGLRLHKASSLKGWVFHKLLESRVGLELLTKCSLVQNREPERFCDFKWRGWMQCALHAIGVENGWVAFSFPQNADMRCMALLIGKEQRSPCGFAKIALDEMTRKLFKNEADALKYLSCKGGLRTVSVPKLLHEGEYGQAYYFIQSVIPSQTRYLSDLGGRKWMSILNELGNINRTSRVLSQYGWWQEVKRTGKPTRLLLPLLESEADKTISGCSAHGDFGPGNILANGEHVWLYDWEGFDVEAPIMTDYLSYVLECFLQSRWRFVPNRLLAKRVLDYLWQNVEFADRKNVALALAYHSTKRGWTLNDDLCWCLCDDVLKRS